MQSVGSVVAGGTDHGEIAMSFLTFEDSAGAVRHLVHLEDKVDVVSVSVVERSVPHKIIDFPGMADL